MTLKVDAGLYCDLAGAQQRARALEDAGYDGVFAPEIAHDPFLPLALAATATRRVELGTGIAVALARNPMTLAVTATDIHRLSGGRFVLGLGSQIKPHITKRFSMPWSQPAARMRELILAVRAIWSAWNHGEPLRFRGDFYRHTLMTPMFDPGPSPVGDPRIFLAAVGPGMTAVAGAVADGFIAHAFTTAAYFRDVTMPAIERGLGGAQRARADLEITLPLFIVTGRDERELASRALAVRRQLAFYGSTPAYLPVLEHHGWGDLGRELNVLSKQGEWERMGDAVDRDVLEAFAVVGEPTSIAPEIARRYGGILDRVQLGTEHDDAAAWAEIVDSIRRL